MRSFFLSILVPVLCASAALDVAQARMTSVDARETTFADFEAGYLTYEEAALATWPDARDYLLQNGMLWNAGTYGRKYGSDYLSLSDLWSQMTNEKLQHFRMILLYNIAERGAYAQTVRILTRPAGSRFNYMDLSQWRLEDTWKISSGVDGPKKIRTITGLFKINPDRVTLEGRAWGANDPMPHSMYIHYRYCDQKRWSGIATHGTPFESNLGRRASSGCMRLSRANAKSLYERVTSEFRGPVPATQFCDGTRQAPGAEHLEVMRDRSGQLILEDGYQVLFVVHDDPSLR